MHIKTLFFNFFMLFFLIANSEAADSLTPWDFKSPVINESLSVRELSLPAKLLKGGVSIFSDYVSKVDGDRCHMYPSCSAYGKEAIDRHGFFLGALLTADRLIHERNEMDLAPQIIRGERLK